VSKETGRTPEAHLEMKANMPGGPRTTVTSLRIAVQLLPTPTAQAAKHGETPDEGANAFGYNLWDLPTLLPTPTARLGDPKSRGAQAKRYSDPERRYDLDDAVASIGESSDPPSDGGSGSPDQLRFPSMSEGA
jgi:hypothetical protein